MAEKKTTVVRGSFPIFMVMFLIFMTLKLAEVGQVALWSWWWVTAPLWIPLSVGLVLILVIGLLALIVYAFSNDNRRVYR